MRKPYKAQYIMRKKERNSAPIVIFDDKTKKMFDELAEMAEEHQIEVWRTAIQRLYEDVKTRNFVF